MRIHWVQLRKDALEAKDWPPKTSRVINTLFRTSQLGLHKESSFLKSASSKESDPFFKKPEMV